MTFALYGSIPAVGKGSVAPLSRAQADSGRVEFRFSVGDESYTAVRLMVRQGSGATTTEARLLVARIRRFAGTADEVTDAVTDLLGLRDTSIRSRQLSCPKAPSHTFSPTSQDIGRPCWCFARHGSYEQVMQLANQRAKLAEGRAKSVSDSPAKLDVVSPEQLQEASRVLAELAGARSELPARLRSSTGLDGLLGEADPCIRRRRKSHLASSNRGARRPRVPRRGQGGRRRGPPVVERSLAGAVEAASEIDAAYRGAPPAGQSGIGASDRPLHGSRRRKIGGRSRIPRLGRGQIIADRD